MRGYCGFDDTKLTVRSAVNSGSVIRENFWNLKNIKLQVNKFASDSILMMFMPGFTNQSFGRLETAINEYLKTYQLKTPATRRRNNKKLPLLKDRKFLLETGDIGFYPDCLEKNLGQKLRIGVFSQPDLRRVVHQLDKSLIDQIADGKTFISLDYITPYPPGFPIIVPGQVVSIEIAKYLKSLKHGEIHGFKKVDEESFWRLLEMPC